MPTAAAPMKGCLRAPSSTPWGSPAVLDARAVSFEVSLGAPAPVGSFLDLEARVESRDGSFANASATATAEERIVAKAVGRFRS